MYLFPLFVVFTIDAMMSIIGFYGVLKEHLSIVKAMTCYAFIGTVLSIFFGQIGSFLIWFIVLAVHVRQISLKQEEQRNFATNLAIYAAPVPPVAYSLQENGLYVNKQ